MSDDKGITIFNAGDWSKPVNTLVKKVCKCVGTVFGPVGAGANYASRIIDAHADSTAMGIAQRAAHRRHIEDIRHQANIESIVSKALPHVRDDAQPEKINDDWLANFFEKCRNVSDEEVQELWARILASEADDTNSFSVRTVNGLSSFDRGDCELLVALSRFCCRIDGRFAAMILSSAEDLMRQHGLTESRLIELQSIGVLEIDKLSLWNTLVRAAVVKVNYLGHTLHVSADLVSEKERIRGSTANYAVPTTNYLLTQMGVELLAVCDPDPVDGFLEQLMLYWKDRVVGS